MSELSDLVSRIETAMGEVKVVIREAHEANQAIRDSIKEARAVRGELEKIVVDKFNDELKNEITDMSDKLGQVQQKMYKEITDRFTKVADPMLKSLGELDRLVKARILAGK